MRYFLFFILFCISINAYATDGIYCALDGGIATQTNLPSKNQANAVDVTTQLSPSAVRVGVGYNHDLNALLGIALEAGLGWYGKTTYQYADNSESKIRSETSEFLLAGTYHLNKQYDLFIKAGGIRITPIISGIGASHKGASIAFESALGSAYIINPYIAIALTYAYILGRDSKTIEEIRNKPPGLNELLLGIRYTFSG